MFTPVPMSRLEVVVLRRDGRAALLCFGRLGVLQLSLLEPGAETAPLPPLDHGSELARWERILARIRELRLALSLPLQTSPINAGSGKVQESALDDIEAELAAIEARCRQLQAAQKPALARQSELLAEAGQLASYRKLPLPPAELDKLLFLYVRIGRMPKAGYECFCRCIKGFALVFPLEDMADSLTLAVACAQTQRVSLDTALEEAGFSHQGFSAAAGATVEEMLSQRGGEAARLAAEARQAGDSLRQLADEFDVRLVELSLTAERERLLLEAERNFPRTEASALISGWLPEEALPAVRHALVDVTGGCCLISATPASELPDEEIPILLKHSAWLRPFDMLVRAYGLPRYQELAPTFFVAISYVLMFGMMFGDVGHGAMLALGGALAFWLGRTGKLRDMGVICLCGGFCSIFFGIIYGSLFGMPWFRQYALWRDPLEGDPLGIISAAITLGVFVISLGVALNIANQLRQQRWLEAALGKFGLAGAVFYWGMLLLLLKYDTLAASGWLPLFLCVFAGLPLIAWVAKSPLEHLAMRGSAKEHSLGQIAVESFVEVLEAGLSYFSNTISFVRLAAYAMSHAALLMATFVIAAEVARMGSFGPALSVAVIVSGNLVAMALEGLVAGIQALRLEYYEFFGKFYSGSGRAFAPFTLPA